METEVLNAAATREAAILSLSPLVTSIAGRVLRKSGVFVDIDDVKGDGWIGAIRAVDSFDSTVGTSLRQYASRMILGAIYNGLRARDVVPEKVRRKIREADVAWTQIANETGAVPSLASIEQRVPGARRAYAAREIWSVVSFDSWTGDPDRNVMLPVSSGHGPAEIVVQREAMAAINNAVSRLRPLARDVLRTRYLDERRLSTMATELGVSQQRISQVHREALARIRAEIGASDAA